MGDHSWAFLSVKKPWVLPYLKSVDIDKFSMVFSFIGLYQCQNPVKKSIYTLYDTAEKGGKGKKFLNKYNTHPPPVAIFKRVTYRQRIT